MHLFAGFNHCLCFGNFKTFFFNRLNVTNMKQKQNKARTGLKLKKQTITHLKPSQLRVIRGGEGVNLSAMDNCTNKKPG
jgi:hypothetical protein